MFREDYTIGDLVTPLKERKEAKQFFDFINDSSKRIVLR